MRIVMMIVASALCLLAHGAVADEPFGAKPQKFLSYQLGTIEEYVRGRDKPRIVAIAAEVRERKREFWLGWVNQLVNLEARFDGCAEKAMAKREVLLVLGYSPDDLRIVGGVGNTRAEGHAMVAVRVGGQWSVLDNGAYVPRHHIVRPQDVKGFRALATFPTSCMACKGV